MNFCYLPSDNTKISFSLRRLAVIFPTFKMMRPGSKYHVLSFFVRIKSQVYIQFVNLNLCISSTFWVFLTVTVFKAGHFYVTSE